MGYIEINSPTLEKMGVATFADDTAVLSPHKIPNIGSKNIQKKCAV